jgi:hypothetical protein
MAPFRRSYLVQCTRPTSAVVFAEPRASARAARAAERGRREGASSASGGRADSFSEFTIAENRRYCRVMNRPPVSAEALTGGCLCGGVRFEVTLPFRLANHCHCSRCRRHSGTFGLTQGRIARENFRLVKGEDLIRVYRPDNDGAVKAFCSVCGSSLFGGRWPDGSEVSVRFGALDADPGIRPQYHQFVASKASWDLLPDDGLRRFDEANPAID